MEWTRILAYITGSVDRELPLRNEYLAADAAIGWADFCGTIIKRHRELAVRLWLHRRGSVHDWRL